MGYTQFMCTFFISSATSRQFCTTDDIKQAVDAVVGGEMGYAVAANRYKVLPLTLERHFRRENPEKYNFREVKRHMAYDVLNCDDDDSVLSYELCQ